MAVSPKWGSYEGINDHKSADRGIFVIDAFVEHGKEIGRSRFDKADATKAGTQNVDKFARNMLFARAISNGVKWYCPDVFSTAVYTPEELGIQVDGEGEIAGIVE